jgi:hypothetical protein
MSDFKKWVKNRDSNFFEYISQDEFGDENLDQRKELVVLIGPPAVGKSTYVAQKFPSDDVFVINRDDIVNYISDGIGMTYDDMFVLPPKDSVPNTSVSGMEKYGLVKQAPSWMRWTKVVFDKVQDANDRINDMLKKRFKEGIDSGKNVVVVFMSLPNDEDNALVIDTDALPDQYNEALRRIVESTEGQQAKDLADILGRRPSPDGSSQTMLQKLHVSQRLMKLSCWLNRVSSQKHHHVTPSLMHGLKIYFSDREPEQWHHLSGTNH